MKATAKKEQGNSNIRITSNCRYTSSYREANNRKKEKKPGKLTSGTPTTSAKAWNVGNTISKKGLNNIRYCLESWKHQ